MGLSRPADVAVRFAVGLRLRRDSGVPEVLLVAGEPANDNSLACIALASIVGVRTVFGGRDVLDSLRADWLERLAIVGGTMNDEVDDVVRAAAEMDFHVTVIADACRSATIRDHQLSAEVTLPRIAHAIISTEELKRQWLRSVR